MEEIRTDRKHLQPSVPVSADGAYRIILSPGEMAILETEDVLFHWNSAVLMPQAPQGPSSNETKRPAENARPGVTLWPFQHRLEGLDVLYTAFRHLEKQPDQWLLLAGHADTSGAPSANFEISKLRAENVKYLLTGERDPWIDVSFRRHRLEDVQQILAHVHNVFLFGCDPGPIDNKMGKKTRNAAQAFREGFHAIKADLGLAESPNLPSDAFHGDELRKEYWGAVFDLYQWQLAMMLGTTPDPRGMGSWRRLVKFVDPQKPLVGCGESFPIFAAEKKNFRSQENRRVELLFFYPEDAPKLTCPPARGTVHTEAECPLYKANRYRRSYLPLEKKQFVPWVDFQTVDDFGHAVPGFEVLLKSGDGTERRAKTDSKGFGRVYGVPAGELRFARSDETPLLFAMDETPAVIQARPEELGVIHLLAIVRATEEIRKERDERRRKISRGPETESERVGTRSSDPAAVDWVRTVTPAAKTPDAFPSTRSVALTADNLALAAGWKQSGEMVELDLDALARKILPGWFECSPRLTQKGYLLFVVQGEMLMIYDERGEYLRGFPLARHAIAPFGAYVGYETGGMWPIFQDMATMRFNLVMDRRADQTVPLGQFVHGEDFEALRDIVMLNASKERLIYHAPTGGELVWVAVFGGIGALEDYGWNGHDAHVHERNKAVVRNSVTGYEVYLEYYIQKVRKTDSEDELRKLGPPREPYFFPRPIGVSEAQWQELAELNRASSYRAWEAVAGRVDYFAGRVPPGTLYLKPKFKVKAQSPQGYYSEVEVEWNFSFDANGGLIKHKENLKVGYSLEARGELRHRVPGIAVEHSIDSSHGNGKTSAKIKIPGGELKVESDGGVEIKKTVGPGGALVSLNPRQARMGGGVFLKFQQDYSDGSKTEEEIQILLCFEGIRRETLLAVLSHAPGFFDRRSVGDLLGPATMWVDLNLDEQAKLERLGWSPDSWNAKRGRPLSGADYPASARTPYEKLSPGEQIAAVHLGFDADTWLSSWRKIAAP